MHNSRILAIAAVLAFTVAIALSPAQQPTGGSKGPPGGTTGTPGNTTGNIPNTPGRPGSINNPNNPNNPTSPFPGDVPRPIFVSGKVVLQDGTPLSEPVLIERVCNGNPHPEGYTDSKGRFSIQLGQGRVMSFADASEPPTRGSLGSAGITNPGGGIRESALMNCDLRASLPGYRSDVVMLANHRYMDNPDVGTIVLHRMGNVEGFTTSATSALAPKDARKAFEKGLDAVKKSKPDEAQKEFEKAVETYPKYASAWFELGRVYEQRDHPEEARKAYNQALAADSKYINPYERLYLMALKEAKWQEVADTTDRVLRLNPFNFPGAYYFNAVANLQLQHLDVAEKNAREALKLDSGQRNPRINYVLGVILAQKQDFAASAECLRAYLKAAPEAKDAETVRKQLAEVEKFAQAKAQPNPPQ